MLQVMVQNLELQAKFSCRWIKLTRKGAIENLKWMLRHTALLKFVDSRAKEVVEKSPIQSKNQIKGSKNKNNICQH